ncbi:MAG TPA: hypothetical protein VGH85_00865 [Mycobacteriales bacterium]
MTETPWESPAGEDDDPTLEVSDDPEVDPADAQEQAEEVPLDEDERG